MRYKPIWTLSLVSAALLAAAAPAAAAPRRVLVLPFSGSLPDAPTAPARLTEVVARAAGLTGNDVILGKATFNDAATLAGCSDQTTACIAQVAGSLHVDQLVIGAVEQTSAGSVAISLKVFAGGEVTEKVLEFPASDLDTLVDRLAREVPGVFATSGIEPEPARPEPAPEPAAPTRPVTPAPPPSPERDDDGFSFGRVGALPWIVTGTGVVATGAGTALYLMGRNRQSEVDEAPTGSVEELDRLEALEDEGDRYLKLGSGMMIGGGAVLAGGIILMIVSGSGSSDDGASASLAPMLTPGGIGLCLELTR